MMTKNPIIARTCSFFLMAAVALALCFGLSACMQRTSTVAQNAHSATLNRESVTMPTVGIDYRYFFDVVHHRYPNVKLTLVTYAGANTSTWELYSLEHNDAPDIIITETVPSAEIQETYLVDLTETGLPELFNQTIVENASANGTVYLIPGKFSVTDNTYDVQFYFGVNKKLTEEGHEQQLEDALDILRCVGTKAGQDAFQPVSEPELASSLADETLLDDDDPMLEVSAALADGTCTMAEADRTPASPVIATVDHDFTLEETAQLVGRMYAQATGADIALITMGGFHGTNEENELGVNGKLYEGSLTADEATTILPQVCDTVETVPLTGEQIQDLIDRSFIKYDESATGGTYPYVVTVKNDTAIQADKTYLVVMVPYTYSNYFAAQHQDIEKINIDLKAYAVEFFQQEGTVTSQSCVYSG